MLHKWHGMDFRSSSSICYFRSNHRKEKESLLDILYKKEFNNFSFDIQDHCQKGYTVIWRSSFAYLTYQMWYAVYFILKKKETHFSSGIYQQNFQEKDESQLTYFTVLNLWEWSTYFIKTFYLMNSVDFLEELPSNGNIFCNWRPSRYLIHSDSLLRHWFPMSLIQIWFGSADANSMRHTIKMR